MRREVDFPSDPQERLGAVLASFNIGPKAVTHLLLPPPDSYISPTDLARSFKEVFKGTDYFDGLKRGGDVARTYCLQSLCPIGVVAEEIEMPLLRMGISTVLIGFSRTEGGEKYGVPSAAHILAFEKEQEMSLHPILGSTNSPDPEHGRSPAIRARILSLLYEKGRSLREIDISDEIGISPKLTEFVLNGLARSGVIFYEAMNTRTGDVRLEFYKGSLPRENVKTVSSYTNLTQRISDICIDLDNAGLAISSGSIVDRLPDELRDNWKEERLKNTVVTILSGLATQGFLVRGKFKGAKLQSRTEISQIGKEVVEKVIFPLQEMTADGGELNRATRETAPRVSHDLSTYAATTAELYYRYSMSYKKMNTQKIEGDLLMKLRQTPHDGLNVYTLSHKMKLSEAFVKDRLAHLERQNLVRRERRRGVNYWFPVRYLLR